MFGVRQILIEDVREEFVRDFVFPMFRANAMYEGLYLLGTSIARPLIAKRQIEIAREVGADAVCHGATGKGNAQVRRSEEHTSAHQSPMRSSYAVFCLQTKPTYKDKPERETRTTHGGN